MQQAAIILIVAIAAWLMFGRKKAIGCAGCAQPNCPGRLAEKEKP